MNRKYEALGFVEALIAIMIVGISSVILMQIAVNTIQNTIQNEVIDDMTQYAVEGSEIAQEISNREIATGTDYFPNPADWGYCFEFDQVDGEAEFRKNAENVFFKTSLEERDDYKDTAILNEEDKLFRIVCIDESTSPTPSFAIAKVVVGQRNSDGDITKGNLVKDYTYLTVIKL